MSANIQNFKIDKLGGGWGYLVSIVLSISFLMMANVRADIVSWYSDQGAYNNSVTMSDWVFESFNQISGNKSPAAWDFTMLNENADARSIGTLTMSNYKGAGGIMQDPTVTDNGGASFWHNSANNLDLAFSFDFGGMGPFVDSFYFGLVPHSSWSADVNFQVTADYWHNGQMYTTDAYTLNQDGWFFGITLDEGAYLAGINAWSTGTPNNGYKIEMGFGGDVEPNPAVPEPATLAIVGLGLAGLGLARARRMKK